MATAADKDDVLVGKVFNFLCDYGLVKFTELLKKPSPLTTRFTPHELMVWIKKHLSTDPRFAVKEARGKIINVKIVSKVRMCSQYADCGKCRSKGECKFWHVCKDYIEENCAKNCRHGKSHDFCDADNGGKTEQLGSGRKLQSGTVRRIVAVNLLRVCSDDVKGSCNVASCPHLHLCAGFVKKTCFNSSKCNRSHNLRSHHNRFILWKNGFKPSSNESELICNILLPKNVVIPNNPVNSMTTAAGEKGLGRKSANFLQSGNPTNMSRSKKSETSNQRRGPQAVQSTLHSLNLNVLSSPNEEEVILSSDDNESVSLSEASASNLLETEAKAVNRQAIKSATRNKRHTDSRLRRTKRVSQSIDHNILCPPEGHSLSPQFTQGLPPPPAKNSTQSDQQGACNRSMSTIPEPLCGLTNASIHVQQPAIGKPQMKGVVNCRTGGGGNPRTWVGKGRGMCSTSHQGDSKRPGNPPAGCSGLKTTPSKVQYPLPIQRLEYAAQVADNVMDKQASAATDGEGNHRTSKGKTTKEPGESSFPDPQRPRKSEQFGAMGQSNNITAEKRTVSKTPEQQLEESDPASTMSPEVVGYTSECATAQPKWPPLQKAMVSSDETTSTSSFVSSKIEPVDISEKQVFECICKEYDCSVKFFDIVSEHADLFPNGKADAEAWFRKDARKNSFIITEGDNKEIVQVTAFSSKLRLCPSGSNCSKDGCSYFHVCRDFIAGCCELGACCPHGHEFRNHKDKRLVSSLQILNSFTEEQLGCIFRASTPRVCLDYNDGKCQKDQNCNMVHICRDFVRKCCRSGACSLDHDDAYETPHTKALAEKFRMSVLTLKRVVVAPQPPFPDHEPIDYSAHICHDYILGHCKNGPLCIKQHCLQPYQWQYRDKSSDQKWQSFPDDDNRDLERLFCNPGKDNNVRIRSRTPFRNAGGQVNVDFENMTLSATPLAGSGPIAAADMRRLSTESYGTMSSDILTTAWTWYWQDNSNAWIPCGSGSEDKRAATQREIETAFLSNDGCCYYCSHQEPYKLYFRSKPMYQKNKRLNTKTLIRRRPKFQSEEKILQLKSKDFMRVRLSPTSEEFKTVQKQFRRTMPEAETTIVQVERVQNPFMLEKFNRKKNRMEARSKGISLEKSLFHGTNSENVDKICQHNFGDILQQRAQSTTRKALSP